MHKELERVIKKQFEFAGALDVFEKIDFKEAGWWDKASWSKNQRNNFLKWFKRELKSREELRETLMKSPSLKEDDLKIVIAWWDNAYSLSESKPK